MFFMTLLLFMVVACKQSNVQQAEMKTTYKLLTIKPSSINTTSIYSAAIKGIQDVEVFPQIGGYLTQVNVNEGEKVKKGDVLFVIEQASHKAALEAAKAGVEVAEAAVADAQANYDNSSFLRERNIISKSAFLKIENALKGAKSQLALAKAQEIGAQTNLDFTVIKSPSNGVVGKLPYKKGALVSAALPKSLTVVSDNSKMCAYFSMNENQVLNLLDKYGSLDNVICNMPFVQLELNNGTMYNKDGKIESISGVIEGNSGALSVRAIFPNKEGRLLSGGSGNIYITEEFNNSIVIPKSATVELQNKFFVYKVVDKKAVSALVEIARNSTDNEYIVTKGLATGDVIIAEGAGLIREGSPVNQ